jgi:ribosome biogenesis GTPase
LGKDIYYDYEEDFHAKGDKKSSKKQRKIASEKDRSKYKKTDSDKLKKNKSSSKEDLSHLSRGLVLSISPEGIIVDSENTLWTCQLKGALKQEKNRAKNLVAVGDYVLFEKKDHNTGSISHIEDRKSILSRADNLSRRKEQLIAVNIDQVIITCSVVFPALKPSLVDRYIIAAQKGNMSPIIVVNKIDLLEGSPEGVDPITQEVESEILKEFLKAYEALSIPVVLISTKTEEGIKKLKDLMHGKTSVFSGQSGVGKSSLINAVTGSSLKTGDVVMKTNKGSHTTTSTHLVPVDGGGFCIDTPGIKSFGVWDLDEKELLYYYPEFFPFAKDCRFPDCTHLNEPNCAVIQAVDDGSISELRFASYCALMTSLSQEHRHR